MTCLRRRGRASLHRAILCSATGLRVLLLLLLAVLAVGSLACSGGEAAAGMTRRDAVAPGSDAGSPEAEVETSARVHAGGASGPAPDAVVSSALIEPGELRTVLSVRVVGRVGPDGEAFEVALRTPGVPSGHARRFGSRDLQTVLRTRSPDLSQYPCASCHAGARLTTGIDRVADAHPDIPSLHPAETGAACTSCHASTDVDLLTLQSGEVVTLDHVYRLCAQCHFREADGWAAGAHGKRLDGWQGRRVVMSCTDCHDPHEPSLETRMPFRPPRLQRSRE
jgi:hypothetical protein